jgi:hypothetical protein
VIHAASLALALAVTGALPLPLPGPSVTPSTSTTPAPVPSVTPATSATIAPAPSAPAQPPAPETSPLPSPGVSSSEPPEPVASPSPDPYKYTFVPRQPDHVDTDAPQILIVYLNDRKLRSRGPIMIKVVTSQNVVKVVTRSNGHEGLVPAVAPGDFEANSTLPKIPFIAAGMTTLLEFVAFTADGKSVSVKVPVKL